MKNSTLSLPRQLVCLLVVASVLAVPVVTEAQTRSYTFSARDKIQLGKRRIRHEKAQLRIVDLNPVRYVYSVNGERVAVADIELSKLPFLPPIPSSGSPAAGAPAPSSQSVTASILGQQVVAKMAEVEADRANIRALEARRGERGLSRAKRAEIERDLRRAQKELEDDQKELERLQALLAVETLRNRAINEITNEFNKIQGRAKQAENDVTSVELKAKAVRDGVELAKREVDSLISKSNDDLGTNGQAGTSLLRRVGTAIDAINAAIPRTTNWPDADIAKAKTDLLLIQSDLDALPVRFPDGWPDWIKNAQNAAALNTLNDRVKALLAYLDTLKPIRDEWDKQVAKLIEVREFLIGIRSQGEQAFSRTLLPFDCGSGIDNTPIKLTTTDRMGVEKEQTIEMVTFECASPLSVSAGFAFGTRDEDEFALINQVNPGNGNPMLEQFKIIGSNKRSRFRPIPMLLLNTRIRDFSDDWGVHFSFGAGVDLKSGNIGSDLEFLVGPSLLLKDRFFFTLGAHVGREVRLDDGFKLGQPVPNDLAAVPTFKRYTTGVGIAFTYRIR